MHKKIKNDCELNIYSVLITMCDPKLRVEYVTSVHDAFDKQDIVLSVALIVEKRKLTELWTTRGHVHVRHGTLKARTL